MYYVGKYFGSIKHFKILMQLIVLHSSFKFLIYFVGISHLPLAHEVSQGCPKISNGAAVHILLHSTSINA